MSLSLSTKLTLSKREKPRGKIVRKSTPTRRNLERRGGQRPLPGGQLESSLIPRSGMRPLPILSKDQESDHKDRLRLSQIQPPSHLERSESLLIKDLRLILLLKKSISLLIIDRIQGKNTRMIQLSIQNID